MKMTIDHIRERDLERAGIDSGSVQSDGHRVSVELAAADFDRLVGLATSAHGYWRSGASLIDEDVA